MINLTQEEIKDLLVAINKAINRFIVENIQEENESKTKLVIRLQLLFLKLQNEER
jgi:hypothetical protein